MAPKRRKRVTGASSAAAREADTPPPPPPLLPTASPAAVRLSSSTSSNDDDTFTSEEYVFKVVLVGDAQTGKTSLLKRLCDCVAEFNQCPSSMSVEQQVRTVSAALTQQSNYHSDGSAEDDAPAPTVGSDVTSSTLLHVRPGVSVRLQWWDTAGEAALSASPRSVFSGAALVLCVFDVTKKATLLHRILEVEIPTVAELLPSMDVDHLFVVGNKTDCLAASDASSPLLDDEPLCEEEEEDEEEGFAFQNKPAAAAAAALTQEDIRTQLLQVFPSLNYGEVSARTGCGVADLLSRLCAVLLGEPVDDQMNEEALHRGALAAPVLADPAPAAVGAAGDLRSSPPSQRFDTTATTAAAAAAASAEPRSAPAHTATTSPAAAAAAEPRSAPAHTATTSPAAAPKTSAVGSPVAAGTSSGSRQRFAVEEAEVEEFSPCSPGEVNDDQQLPMDDPEEDVEELYNNIISETGGSRNRPGNRATEILQQQLELENAAKKAPPFDDGTGQQEPHQPPSEEDLNSEAAAAKLRERLQGKYNEIHERQEERRKYPTAAAGQDGKASPKPAQPPVDIAERYMQEAERKRQEKVKQRGCSC